MTNTKSNTVDFTKYGCFVSYGIKPVSTAKPGINNYYIKDAYKDISNYHNRKIKFFEDKSRWNSVYDKDLVKTVKEEAYNFQKGKDLSLIQYEYSHDKNLQDIVTSRKPIKTIENEVRERFAASTDSFARKKMFSNYTTTYDYDNAVVQENLKNNFKKAEIPDLFKAKYHNYNKGTYSSEYTGTFGSHGDVPKDKFFNTSQNPTNLSKYYSDNYDIGKGTAKHTNQIVGYKGFMPVNNIQNKETHSKDSFINVMKTNHLDNYKTRIPGYAGHIPMNSINIKGNLRPNCLSTKDEKY